MLADPNTSSGPIMLHASIDLDATDKITSSNNDYVSELQDYNVAAQLSAVDTRMASKMCQIVNYTGAYKKPCNCAKSHCLKLYCECFARGSACDNCNCSNCLNNEFHEEERRRAIKLTLERNPLAFHPKIGEGERKHSKGCNCKRSGCLKNYCECYEAKITCSDLCRCQGCRNFDNGCGHKGSQELQAFSLGRTKGSLLQKKMNNYYAHASIDNPYRDPYVKLPHANQLFGRAQSLTINGAQTCYFEEPLIPSGFLSLEVTEAACSCMLAQLNEAKQRSASPSTQERIVLEEFGRCLEQILDSASKLQQGSVIPENMQYAPYDLGTNPDFVTILPGSRELDVHGDTNATDRVMESMNYIADAHVTTQSADTGPVETYDTKDMELMHYRDPLDPSFGGQLHYVNQTDKLGMPNAPDLDAQNMMNGVPFQIDRSATPNVVGILNADQSEKFPTATEPYFQLQQPHPQQQLKISDEDCFSVSNLQCNESYVNELNNPRMTHLTTFQGILTPNTSSNIITDPGSVPVRHQPVNPDSNAILDLRGHVTMFNELKPSEDDEEEQEASNATAALLNVSCTQESNRFMDFTESGCLSSSTDPFAFRNLNLLDAVSPTEGHHHQPQREQLPQHQSQSLSVRSTFQPHHQQSLNHIRQIPAPFHSHMSSEGENYDPLAYAGQIPDENPSFLKSEIGFFDL